MNLIRKIRIRRLSAETLADPNVPNYIKAGFKTELAFLKWLAPKTRTENNLEEYRKWGYSSRAEVLSAYGDALRKAHGLPLSIKIESDEEDEQTCFVVPSGRRLEG